MEARTIRTGASLMLTALLCACGGRAFEYRSHNEIPTGPGMMTGEAGAFVLGAPGRREAAGPAAPARPETRAAAAGNDTEAVESDGYRAYRRAKAERSDEYREFLEWREWRRYLEWKRERDAQPK